MLYRQMGKTGDMVSILGYGCMRYPKIDGRIDEKRTESQMISAIERGVNYFDTAYLYHGGKSESILGDVLAKGYRDKVYIATKLPFHMVHSPKDIENIFNTQLKRLRTDHIDYYLMHTLFSMGGWEGLKSNGIVEFLEEQRQAGKIRHVGFSFHGDCTNFKDIIDDYPWDFCQIQYNYLDENHQAGREGLIYAASKGMGVIVMEPLRGGNLAGKMPDEVTRIWNRAQNKRTPAEWALRWLWDQPQITTVLSGMNEETHIDENIRVASEAAPNSLTREEVVIIDEVKETLKRMMRVGCTACGYCMPCPAGVNIPLCFGLYNNKHMFNEKLPQMMYMANTGAIDGGKPSYASLCINCGKCEKVCPQNLPIRRHLSEVTKDMQPLYFMPAIKTIRGYFKLRKALRRS